MNEGVAIHEIIYNPKHEAIDYIITDINHAYETIVGLRQSEVVGKKLQNFMVLEILLI